MDADDSMLDTMDNMTETPVTEESGDSDRRKLMQSMDADDSMLDTMDNMTETPVAEESGDSDRRKLLQDLLDGVIDMPNMTNITQQVTDTVTQTVTDGAQSVVYGANDLVSSIGGRKLLLA